MARIAGVNIPTNKRVVIALTYIHGIGPAKAKAITEKLSIVPERRVQCVRDHATRWGSCGHADPVELGEQGSWHVSRASTSRPTSAW